MASSIGGVDPDDTADPAATRAAIEAAPFVVSLEQRLTDVTRPRRRRAPGRPGRRQGRHLRQLGGPPAPLRGGLQQPRRRCPTCASSPASPTSSALAGRSASAPSPRCAPRWRPSAPGTAPAPRSVARQGAAQGQAPRPARSCSSTWKQLLDRGSMQDGDANLAATAAPGRRPDQPGGVRRPLRDARGAAQASILTGDRGSVTLPVEVADDCPTASCGCRPTRSGAACSPTWPRPAAPSR